MRILLPRLLGAVLVSGAFALPTSSHAKSKQTSGPVLQVQLNMPPSWQPIFEDEVADAFISHVRDVFQRRGYEGTIKEVDALDEPDPGCCLLTINLLDWRMGHTGSIECTFTGTLQTEHGTRSLGIYTNSAFRWMNGPGRFGLADTFDDAARGAIRDLYHDVAKTELVPGLRA